MMLKFPNYDKMLKLSIVNSVPVSHQFSDNFHCIFQSIQEYINQYTHPAKRNNIKIKAHGYSKFYEKIFLEFKDKKINILEIG